VIYEEEDTVKLLAIQGSEVI